MYFTKLRRLIFHHQGKKIGELRTALALTTCDIEFRRCIFDLLATNNIPSLPIFVTLTVEAMHSSEMSDLTRVIWRNFPEDGIFHTTSDLQGLIMKPTFSRFIGKWR
jgi:hypothetical protein